MKSIILKLAATAALTKPAALAKFARTGLALALLTLPGALLAQGTVIDFGGYYAAGIKEQNFRYHASMQPRGSNWCWAACVQMVLHYQGISISQEEIVREIKGRVVNQGGTDREIARAVNGRRVNGRTLKTHVHSQPDVNAKSAEMIDYLAKKHPMIVGMRVPGGYHAYVLTAIYYRTHNGDANGRKTPYQVVLRDPQPRNPRDTRVFMPWSEFARNIDGIVYVYPSTNNQ